MQVGTYTLVATILFWFYVISFAAIFLLHLLGPAFLKIFRSMIAVVDTPAQENLSEVFRTAGLKTPRLYLTNKQNDRSPFYFIGFLNLPSLFRATLVISKEIFKKLTSDELKMIFYAEAAQAKLSQPFLAAEKYLLGFFASLFFVWTFIFYPYLSCTPDQYHGFFSTIFAVGVTVGYFYFRKWRHDRFVFANDFQAIRFFNLDSEKYFSAMEKCGLLAPSNLDRRKYYLNLSAQVDAETFKFPSFSLFQKILSPTSIVVIALNWIAPFSYYAFHYGPTRMMTTAIQSQDYSTIRELVSKSDNLEVRDPFLNGATPALIAAQSGELQILYSILVAGGNYTETDDLDRDILFYAIQSKDRERVVKYLLQTDVDINHRDFSGNSALDYARQIGSAEIEKALLEKGASARSPATNNLASQKMTLLKTVVDKLFIF